MKRYSLLRALQIVINAILPVMVSRRLRYLVVTLTGVFILYAVLKSTYYCKTIFGSSVSEKYDLPDYLKKLSTSSVLEYFNDVNSILGTTGPGIPVAIRSILSKKYGGVNSDAVSSYGAAPGM